MAWVLNNMLGGQGCGVGPGSIDKWQSNRCLCARCLANADSDKNWSVAVAVAVAVAVVDGAWQWWVAVAVAVWCFMFGSVSGSSIGAQYVAAAVVLGMARGSGVADLLECCRRHSVKCDMRIW